MTGIEMLDVFGAVAAVLSFAFYGLQRVKRSLVPDLTQRQMRNLRGLERINEDFERRRRESRPKPSWINLTSEESEKWKADLNLLQEDFTEAVLPILTKDLEYLMAGDPQRYAGEVTAVARSVFHGRCAMLTRIYRGIQSDEELRSLERELQELGTMLTNPAYGIGSAEDRHRLAWGWIMLHGKMRELDNLFGAIASIPGEKDRHDTFTVMKDLLLSVWRRTTDAMAETNARIATIRAFVRRRTDIFGDVALATG